jgi:hypothetical protein
MQGSTPVECEVLNVIQGAGIWPDCDDKTQLLQAIQKLATTSLPTRQYFTEDGSFVVPEGVSKLRVTVAGAGGGGGLNGNGPAQKSEDGGDSTVTVNGQTVFAGGGKGAWSALSIDLNDAIPGKATNGDINLIGQGGIGGRGTTDSEGRTGGLAGNGGLAIRDFNVSPGDTLQVVIGAGGTTGATRPGDLSWNYGQDGYAVIEWA